MFELRGVSKLYDGVEAVRRLDLSIAPKRTTVLIGPSGCGKSTLLRLMIGLLQPDEGLVLFEGIDLALANPLPLRRRMGYVIQEGGLFPHMTAARNASVVAGYLGWPSSQINARLNDLAQLVRLPTDMLRRLPDELSGGQRQRV